jgi:hypothetical protein
MQLVIDFILYQYVYYTCFERQALIIQPPFSCVDVCLRHCLVRNSFMRKVNMCSCFRLLELDRLVSQHYRSQLPRGIRSRTLAC